MPLHLRNTQLIERYLARFSILVLFFARDNLCAHMHVYRTIEGVVCGRLHTEAKLGDSSL